MKEKYGVAVKNRFEALSRDATTKWEPLKNALVDTCKQIIPKTKTRTWQMYDINVEKQKKYR